MSRRYCALWPLASACNPWCDLFLLNSVPLLADNDHFARIKARFIGVINPLSSLKVITQFRSVVGSHAGFLSKKQNNAKIVVQNLDKSSLRICFARGQLLFGIIQIRLSETKILSQKVNLQVLQNPKARVPGRVDLVRTIFLWRKETDCRPKIYAKTVTCASGGVQMGDPNDLFPLPARGVYSSMSIDD